MSELESVPVIEFSNEFQGKALDAANNFLNSPDTARVKELDFLSTNVENQIISKTVDESSNTAFHIESGSAAGSFDPDAKKTVINWLTLGEDKGDLPAGCIEILESGGEKQIFAYKVDKPGRTDEEYLWGGSNDAVNRTNDMTPHGVQIPLSEEQASQILARLEASKVNKEQTESTAKLMDADNRHLEAIVEFQRADSASMIERLYKLPAARNKLIDAGIKLRETEEEIKKKMKKMKINDEEETASNESTKTT